MHITGPRDGPPVKVGVAITDLTTGMYAANSILAAIIERARSNKGQYLDVCLSDCQVATLSNMAESVLVTGQRDTGRWGTSHRKSRRQRSLLQRAATDGEVPCELASVVPYRSFKTTDGDILIGGANDRMFGLLCKGLGHPEWAADERFSNNASRVRHRDVLEPMLENILSTKSTKEWLDTFDGTGLPYAKVNDLKDTLEHEHGGFLLKSETDVSRMESCLRQMKSAVDS